MSPACLRDFLPSRQPPDLETTGDLPPVGRTWAPGGTTHASGASRGRRSPPPPPRMPPAAPSRSCRPRRGGVGARLGVTLTFRPDGKRPARPPAAVCRNKPGGRSPAAGRRLEDVSDRPQCGVPTGQAYRVHRAGLEASGSPCLLVPAHVGLPGRHLILTSKQCQKRPGVPCCGGGPLYFSATLPGGGASRRPFPAATGAMG